MSNMETVVHTYLTKLRIISKIPVNGRLNITNNDLDIYKESFINWILRKWGNDCKDNATKYLYDLYRDINSFSNQIMDNINFEQIESRKVSLIIMLVSLTEKIKESLSGIRNLIGTYKEWLKTSSNLECLEQDIIMPQFRILKNFIPGKFHTDIIKSNVTYSHVYTGGMISSPLKKSPIDKLSTNGDTCKDIGLSFNPHPLMDKLTPEIDNSLDAIFKTSSPIDIPVKTREKSRSVNDINTHHLTSPPKPNTHV